MTLGFSYWIMSAWALFSSFMIVKVEKAVLRSEHMGSVSAIVSTASRISSPAASIVDIIVDVSVDSMLALTPLPRPSARTTIVESSFSTISTWSPHSCSPSWLRLIYAISLQRLLFFKAQRLLQSRQGDLCLGGGLAEERGYLLNDAHLVFNDVVGYLRRLLAYCLSAH